jgi:protein farnesyltransferase/geranylgeranyltransferase type-1 subunit alpha
MADESFESDGSKDLEYDVPYSDRPEWDDVTPIKQDDGPDPIVRIAYDPQCA